MKMNNSMISFKGIQATMILANGTEVPIKLDTDKARISAVSRGYRDPKDMDIFISKDSKTRELLNEGVSVKDLKIKEVTGNSKVFLNNLTGIEIDTLQDNAELCIYRDSNIFDSSIGKYLNTVDKILGKDVQIELGSGTSLRVEHKSIFNLLTKRISHYDKPFKIETDDLPFEFYG